MIRRRYVPNTDAWRDFDPRLGTWLLMGNMSPNTRHASHRSSCQQLGIRPRPSRFPHSFHAEAGDQQARRTA